MGQALRSLQEPFSNLEDGGGVNAVGDGLASIFWTEDADSDGENDYDEHLDDDADSEPSSPPSTFPDLRNLPPELALEVLSKLKATDLCLAECVWQQLASDQILWQGLCKEQWPEASIYSCGDGGRSGRAGVHFKKLYLRLDEGTLTFNSDAEKGMSYFFDHGLLADRPADIARFFHSTGALSKAQVRRYLQGCKGRPAGPAGRAEAARRQAVMDCMVEMQDYRGQFLPNALRKCFSKLEAPDDRGAYLQRLLAAFSERFCKCNPALGYSNDAVYVMCFSLILLSVDLTSPHVKNKMSKREFIRNTRNAVSVGRGADNELFGELYDNVFLRGHVSGEGKALQKTQHQFVPGYLAIFL